MAATGFFNDNANRSYPFLAEPDDVRINGTAAPDDFPFNQLVVDFGCDMGVRSGWAYGVVSLESLTIFQTGSDYTFTFRLVATGIGEPLEFLFAFSETTLPCYETVFSEADASLSDICGESTEPVWDGFLVCGDLAKTIAALEAVLGADISCTITANALVEPARVTGEDTRVRALHVLNLDQRHVERDAICKPFCWPVENPHRYWNQASCLRGPVAFREGYNCSIVARENTNTLMISARLGSGMGELTEDPPRLGAKPGDPLGYPHSPVGRTTKDGAWRCEEVLRSINGVSSQQIEFRGGEGVTVTAYPEQSRIVIDVAGDTMANCLSLDDYEMSYSLDVSYGTGECACGPKPEET